MSCRRHAPENCEPLRAHLYEFPPRGGREDDERSAFVCEVCWRFLRLTRLMSYLDHESNLYWTITDLLWTLESSVVRELSLQEEGSPVLEEWEVVD